MTEQPKAADMNWFDLYEALIERGYGPLSLNDASWQQLAMMYESGEMPEED